MTGPTIDGDLIPDLPRRLYKQGRFIKDIDVMTSHTANEVFPSSLRFLPPLNPNPALAQFILTRSRAVSSRTFLSQRTRTMTTTLRPTSRLHPPTTSPTSLRRSTLLQRTPRTHYAKHIRSKNSTSPAIHWQLLALTTVKVGTMSSISSRPSILRTCTTHGLSVRTASRIQRLPGSCRRGWCDS